MATRYFDRDLNLISKAKWRQLQKDARYRIIRQFENEKIGARVIWIGKVDRADEMHPDFWPMFGVEIYNIITVELFGEEPKFMRVDDPALTRTFSSQQDAIEHYENVIGQWTESELRVETLPDGTTRRVLEEVGNKLQQPEDMQPEADIPASVKKASNPDAGSW